MQHLATFALGFFGLAIPALAGVVDILDLQDGDLIPGKYIVSLKPGVSIDLHLGWVRDVHRRSISRRDTAGLEKTFGFEGFSGYSGEFDDDTIAQILADINVLAVEQDRVARLSSKTQENDAPWGLASISQRAELANGDTTGHTYCYDDTAGAGTFAYVLDSGVLTNNTEFEGRAIKGYSAYDDVESFDDYYGHGTHVAGTIASKTFGVAKKATIVDVKVVHGTGYSTVSRVLDGLNWVVNNITNTPGRAAKSVLNMSLEFQTSNALNNAVDAATSLGILSVVAAGNHGSDASARSPASAPSALTVGAVSWNRTRAYFSNYGSVVDLFAPGVDVLSTWNVEGAQRLDSGTSMASPHVAGLALYLKGLEHGLDSPRDTIARIKKLATPDVVDDAGSGSPNLFAYNGIV
ncbi:subtilisin-like serine protease pepD [Hypoxylon trugodes]|uniref:subtilisin-like serine protease pepD n=1 Tax=Hypoxylon trugodes TaxID=326681 RepID=UPI0021A13BA5|nr:subtilisin-like serine protease pepD [Hypoxylon trugodes]KAI1386784.1 subtilisin-like serine protease pepD [Hypoxylon trugodes]